MVVMEDHLRVKKFQKSYENIKRPDSLVLKGLGCFFEVRDINHSHIEKYPKYI